LKISRFLLRQNQRNDLLKQLVKKTGHFHNSHGAHPKLAYCRRRVSKKIALTFICPNKHVDKLTNQSVSGASMAAAMPLRAMLNLPH
jgi:hypothetical protein